MENLCKSHTSTFLFPPPFSIRVQVCSCLLRPVLLNLWGICWMGSPVGCLGGSPQHHMGLGCAGHLHHHQSSALPLSEDTTPLYSLLKYTTYSFLLSSFTTLPTVLLLCFPHCFPVLLHAHLNIMFPTPFLRQTQPVLVLLMQLLRYKWPCSPKLPLSYAVHAG